MGDRKKGKKKKHFHCLSHQRSYLQMSLTRTIQKGDIHIGAHENRCQGPKRYQINR
jgi:hypothetical protein